MISKNTKIPLLKKVYVFTIIFICISFLGFVGYSIYNEYQMAYKFSLIEAKSSFNKDILYRHWAASHGGVYVPQTQKTQPNPLLEFIPERDIETPSGKKLTLINPAYMTRQVYELAKDFNGVQGHITSLNPIRKENEPDSWENKALLMFNQGVTEFSSIEIVDSVEYLRYMEPMITEKSCLKCHEKQGYKVGEVRGGLSVSVPIDSYKVILFEHIYYLLAFYLLAFIGIITGVSIYYKKLLKENLLKQTIKEELIQSEASLRIQNEKQIQLNKQLHKLNNELFESKSKAEESSRLKTEFINNISHEIRTPLNGIIGFSKLLTMPNVSENLTKMYAEYIDNGGQQLISIVDEIIEISKLNQKQVEVHISGISINELLKSVVYNFEKRAAILGIHLYSHSSDDEEILFSDEYKIQKILQILVDNALKFTPKGLVEIGYTRSNSYGEFYVKDTGVGIPEDKFNDVFFKFFKGTSTTTDYNYDGLGLGLSIAKEYIELLGGTISVSSEISKGTIFTIVIPNKTSDASQKSITPSLAPIFEKRTILLVEDEVMNIEFMKAMLEYSDNNYNVLFAKNGQEAIDVFNSNNEIGLVFMDLKMPIMDGFQATKAIKNINAQVAIVAQTAYSSSEDIQKIKAFGFDDFLIKPISFEEFERVCLKYLR